MTEYHSIVVVIERGGNYRKEKRGTHKHVNEVLSRLIKE